MQQKHAILSGNELIVQGAKEAGFHLFTGYPGSPLADFFNILYSQRQAMEKSGRRVVIGNSEANAAAMASGAKQAGKNTVIAMKSMGLHVAADALSVGQFADPGPKIKSATGELSPGVVVVVGDDPWSISTSTAADSRFLYKHLHMPFLEPSTPQELKDWMALALELSQRSSLYVGVLVTTFMAEGGGRVALKPEAKVDSDPAWLDPASFDLTRNVMVPPNSLIADQRMIHERFPRALKALQELNLDRQWGNASAEVGLIASGLCHEMLKEVLEQAGLEDRVSLYKCAGSYPLNSATLLPWLRQRRHVIVVEEKRAFLEQEVGALILQAGLSLTLHGKEFTLASGEKVSGFTAAGGLDNDLIRAGLDRLLPEILRAGAPVMSCPTYMEFSEKLLRLPTFCPGCPHRDTLSVMKELRQKLMAENIPLLAHGDVGCYSLSFLEPFKEMHNLSAMGQGGALGAGVDLFSKNPSVVLMGDSTFFHSGLTDISNSVQMGHNITYILLDNDNTAMTGHQMSPVSGQSVEGKKRPRQSMAQVARSLGASAVIEINPEDRYFYLNLLSDYVKRDGVKVIVSNKECGLTFHGRARQEERRQLQEGAISEKRFFQINAQACEDCRVCIDMTGCPGLSQITDSYGTKTIIDPQICVSDGHCTRLKVCPSFEEVIVQDYRPPQGALTSGDSDRSLNAPWIEQLPPPRTRHTLESLMREGHTWRAVVVGVGGTGVTTISRVIAHAAEEMEGRSDCDFKFMEQKGLAQRNGRVTGHLALHPHGRACATVTPKGSAQLLIAADLFDGPSALAFLASDGAAVMERDFQVPLSLMLAAEGVEKLPPQKLLARLQEQLGERLDIVAAKDIVFALMGKSIYAPAMLLGAAYQRGLLPFSAAALERALASAIKHKNEYANNVFCFHLGRWWVAYGEDRLRLHFKVEASHVADASLWRQSLAEALAWWHGPREVLARFDGALSTLTAQLPWLPKEHAAQYLHDVLVYQPRADVMSLVSEAVRAVEQLADLDDRKRWLRLFFKTHFIKDEVFVAHQMISPVKRAQDKHQYGNLGRRWKIRRMNRPRFDIFGMALEMDLSPSDWMLKLMRQARWLRPLLISWHRYERTIAHGMRRELDSLLQAPTEEARRARLLRLESVKGYRQVRYRAWEALKLGEQA